MKTSCSPERGFSYIDVIIAIFILMIGILAMVSAITSNLMRIYETEKRTIAKQVALSTIESIISAKEIARPDVIDGWDSIGNVGNNPVGGVPRGIFLNGWCPIREDMGWDGVAGTADDACPSGGPCIVSGRPVNDSAELLGFDRQIVIEDVPDPERPSPPNAITRRRITVTVRYHLNQISREEVVSTIVTNY
jgi:type II secretory pathway pseudopilin PulG